MTTNKIADKQTKQKQRQWTEN